MATQYYLPTTDAARNSWAINFAIKLPLYADKYGVTHEELNSVTNGSAWFNAMLNYQAQFTSFAGTITAFKLALRNGLPAGATLSDLTIPNPFLPDMPAVPGFFAIVASVVNKIKSSLNYSVSDGNDMGIEGSAITPPDPSTLTPTLTVGLAAGGHPDLKWLKQGMGQLEICVDRGLGTGWEPLAISTQAHFVDTHTLPPAGQSAVWTYRAIYRDKDVQAGQWSSPVTAAVMG